LINEIFLYRKANSSYREDDSIYTLLEKLTYDCLEAISLVAPDGDFVGINLCCDAGLLVSTFEPDNKLKLYIVGNECSHRFKFPFNI